MNNRGGVDVNVKNPEQMRNNGDELRNVNSHEYLKNIFQAMQAVEKDLVFLNYALKEYFDPFNEITYFGEDDRYHSCQAYGNQYTNFMHHLEDNIGKIKENIKKDKDAQRLMMLYRALVKSIYANPNKSLERTAEKIAPILENVIHTASHEIECKIKDYMNLPSGVLAENMNHTTPQHEGSPETRFYYTFLSSEFKPQLTTNIPAIRDYAYKRAGDLPMEYRFGTQGERDNGAPRVNPLFKAFLEVQYEELKEKSSSTSSPITHIYFNNLGKDRSDFEGLKEKELTEQLEKLEKDHPNVAVITLPADKGLMDKAAIEDHHRSIDAQDAIKLIIEIAQGDSNREVKDFYISNKIKKLLYGEDGEDGEDVDKNYDCSIEAKVLYGLVKKSFIKLGFEPKPNTITLISPAERQAIYFHFIKYELTNYIIEKLHADFNISCKDAIDRGGDASAYYNLIKSIEQGHPMTKAEFYRALHAAPTLVKGRGMNEHSKLIWNAIDKYINGRQLTGKTELKWLVDWRDKHAPDHSKVKFCNELNWEYKKLTRSSGISVWDKVKDGILLKDKVAEGNTIKKLLQAMTEPDDKPILLSVAEEKALYGPLKRISSAIFATGCVDEHRIKIQKKNMPSSVMAVHINQTSQMKNSISVGVSTSPAVITRIV